MYPQLPNARQIAARAFLRRAIPLAVCMLSVCNPANAQEIHAVSQDGKTVFVNDIPEQKAKPVAQQTVASNNFRYRRLVYWSNTEHRWKPVMPPSPNTMRKAQMAAAEVASYIQAQPEAPASGTAKPHSPFGTLLASTAPPPSVEVKSPAPERDSVMSNPGYSAIARGRLVTSSDLDNVIENSAKRHGVDPNLVRALIKVESNFNPSAVSRKGAMGLMQLMPATARSLNVDDPFDPEQNVEAGVRHLRGLLDNFNGNVALSLAAYNAGEGAVRRFGSQIPPYSETQNYVKRITGMAGAGVVGTIATPARITVKRDENGKLVISNTD